MGLTETLELFEYPNFDFSHSIQPKKLPKYYKRFLKIKLAELQHTKSRLQTDEHKKKYGENEQFLIALQSLIELV